MSKKNFLKRLTLTAISLFSGIFLFAQSAADTTGASSTSLMRSHDKIYVVMAVCITILVVLFLYLIRIDIKVSKKEKAF